MKLLPRLRRRHATCTRCTLNPGMPELCKQTSQETEWPGSAASRLAAGYSADKDGHRATCDLKRRRLRIHRSLPTKACALLCSFALLVAGAAETRLLERCLGFLCFLPFLLFFFFFLLPELLELSEDAPVGGGRCAKMPSKN